MFKNKEILLGKRIGVFGKGGSGKSTFVVLLAKVLHSYNYPVCILDADSTNEGLYRAFGFDKPPKDLVDYFGGVVFRGGNVTCPVDDPSPLENAEIDLMHPDIQDYICNSDGINFMIAGKIGRSGPGSGCDGPISKIARDLVVHNENSDPITLIDFKAGFEDTARGVVTNLNWGIVIVDPTVASIRMAEDMKHMIQEIKSDALPATAHLETADLVNVANKVFTEAIIQDVYFVLNKVPDSETESYLREELLKLEITPLGCIHEYPTISMAWLKGKPIRPNLAGGEVQLVLDNFLENIDGDL